jgi:uncharacterized membrane protein
VLEVDSSPFSTESNKMSFFLHSPVRLHGVMLWIRDNFGFNIRSVLLQNCLYVTIAVFWDVVPCSLIDVYRRFRGACRLVYGGSKDL